MEHSNQIHGKAEWQELRRPGIPLTPEGMRRFTFMMTGATLVFTVAGCNEIFEVFFPGGRVQLSASSTLTTFVSTMSLRTSWVAPIRFPLAVVVYQ